MRRKGALIGLCAVAVLVSNAAWGQPRPDKSWKDWFGHFDASYSLAEGDFGDVADNGFSIGGGATYQPEDWTIGLVLDLEYSEFDISDSVIRDINDGIIDTGQSGRVDDGDLTVWSLTVNGAWSPSDTGKGFYLIAGVGAYRVEGTITDTALVYYPPVCDPWFWWCIPGGVGEGSVVKGNESVTEFGWNAGLGWAFEVGTSSQLYIEARYHSVNTSPQGTDYLPLAIGYRW